MASASSAEYKDASSDRRRSTPMAKPGRNDRCPCGSGKKYKACCLTRDEAAEHERLAAEQAEREERAAAKRLELRKVRDAIAANFAASLDDGEDDLEETVNAALRFIHEDKLEQTETTARHLMDRYPDIPDGWEFLGHVHEKRGENQEPSPAIVVCWRSSTARPTTSTQSTRKGSKTRSPNSIRRRRPEPHAPIEFANGSSHVDLAYHDQQTSTAPSDTAIRLTWGRSTRSASSC